MFKSTRDSKVALGRETLKRMATLAAILTQAMPMPRRKRRAIDQDWVALEKEEDGDWVELTQDMDWMTLAEDGELVNLSEGSDWVYLARKFLKLLAAVVPLYEPFPEDLSVQRSKLLEVLKAGDKVFPVCAHEGLSQTLSSLGDTDKTGMVEQWAQLRTEADQLLQASAPKSTSTLISETRQKLDDARLSLFALDSIGDLKLSLDDFMTLRWRTVACEETVDILKALTMRATEVELKAAVDDVANTFDWEIKGTETSISLEETASRVGDALERVETLRRGMDRELTVKEWAELKALTYAASQLVADALLKKTP
jgi:hypothetical protein